MIYHSALKNESTIDGELEYYENSGSYVFQHDITKGIHQLYGKAEAIYSEPAWDKGYYLFLERAGMNPNSTHNEYLRCIKNIINELCLPTFLVMGKHMVKKLGPEYSIDMKINKGNCILGTWHFKGALSFKTNNEVINFVAENYNNVLDFSCGYGNMAQKMNELKKSFICSDINKKCVYYIAKNIMGYNPNE